MYSVIIPAKNESSNIERCIRSVFASLENNIPIEVIVIDNGSSDNTCQIAEKSGAKVLIQKDLFISGLRNWGVKNASYDVIGFIDADCEALPGWLTNAHNILIDDHNIGIVGDYYQLPKQPGWIEQAYFATLLRKRREVTYLSGGNMVMLRKTFLEVGGFDEKTITGEDYVLCLKVKSAGYKIIADPSVSVIHNGNSKTLAKLFKREMWCGIGTLDIYKYGKITLPLIWSILNLIIILCIVLALVFNYANYAIYLLIFMFILPGLAALKRSIQSKSYRYISQLYLIYAVYGSARTVSLFKRLMQCI